VSAFDNLEKISEPLVSASDASVKEE